jgi:hypothetical protein
MFDSSLALAPLLLDEVQDLVKPGREQVQRGHDPSVGPQSILFHHLLVVHRVPDVDVDRIRHAGHSRVKVHNVWRLLQCMEVSCEPLDERRFP